MLDLQLSTRTAALAYWQGQYVAIDRDEDAARLAEVSIPLSRGLRTPVVDLINSSDRFWRAKRTVGYGMPAPRERIF